MKKNNLWLDIILNTKQKFRVLCKTAESLENLWCEIQTALSNRDDLIFMPNECTCLFQFQEDKEKYDPVEVTVIIVKNIVGIYIPEMSPLNGISTN